MAAARQALASMLDELMGKHRNALPSEKPVDIGFEDPDVCKYYLAGFCHHELFTNTKADLGPCGKTHDEKLREQYRASEKFEKLGYEDEWLVALQRVHNDMQRKIMRNKQRLELTQPGGKIEDANKDTVQAKIDSLSEKITALVHQAETLGAQGRVDEAQKLIEKTEDMKEERDRCRKTVDTPIGELKMMEVCDTCGCFLIVGDSQHRIDEHLTGKQHLGFAKIKATIEELTRKKDERRRLREEEYRQALDEREKRKRERDEQHQHSRHRRRHSSKSRSPDQHAGRSSDRRSPLGSRDESYYRRHEDGRRRLSSRSDRHTARRDYEGERRHSSSSSASRYSNYERHSSQHRRSRSPKQSRSRSPWEENGKPRKERNVYEKAASAGHKVNSSSPNRVLITASSCGHPGPSRREEDDDDEDEEGLIKSSDE